MPKPNFTALTKAATGFLRTPKGKKVGGQVLEQAARAADRATKRKYADKIEGARRAAEQGLGKL